MINIQKELQKIHKQYGLTEMGQYKIQLLCEQYAKEYHDSEVKKLNTPDVVGRSEQLVCPQCSSEDPDYSRGEYHCRCCGHDWAN